MAILKLEVDTDEICSDYDRGVSFETLFSEGIRAEITRNVLAKLAKAPIETETEKIKTEVVQAIDNLLRNLINEELSFTDRWGKPTFVGTVEDYIKQQIDKRLLSPVGEDGRVLEGCRVSSPQPTWVQWVVKKEIADQLKVITKTAQQEATRYCKETLNVELKEFTQNTVRGLVIKQLESVGVINKQEV